jgi:hypothetical protein
VSRQRTLTDGSTGILSLPDLRLAPGDVKSINLSGAIHQSGLLRRQVASAGLEFEYTGAAGSVLMAAQSMSASGNQVFRLPLIDAQAMPSSTGGYPWSIEGESATVVYIKNVTRRRQQYVLQLNYAGGVYAPGLKTVEAGQTAVLDVRALRDHQVPDEHGRVIPLAATRGQVTWSVDGADDLVLIGRAEQADLRHAMSSSYACANCCPASFYDGWCDPASVVGLPGDTTQFRAWQQNEDCFGTLLEPFLRSAGWSSLDTAVATVSTGGLATAQDEGSTHIRANFGTQYVWELLQPSHSCYRTSINPIADALCDVGVPTGLIALSVSTLPTGTSGDYGCTPGVDYGIRVKIRYQVVDQLLRPIRRSDMIPQETLTDYVLNGVPQPGSPDFTDIGPTRISGTSRYTDINGTFLDAPFGGCFSFPFTLSIRQQIFILVNSRRYIVRVNNIESSSSSPGHGSITNGADIQKSR